MKWLSDPVDATMVRNIFIVLWYTLSMITKQKGDNDNVHNQCSGVVRGSTGAWISVSILCTRYVYIFNADQLDQTTVNRRQ